MLDKESLREFRPAKQLAQQVAGKMVERASDRFARGDSAAGWQDLQVAERLGGQSDAVAKLREQMVAATLDEARRYLAAGQASAAAARLAKLATQGPDGRGGKACSNKSPIRCIDAEKAAGHGRFAEAAAVARSGLGRSPADAPPQRVQWISPDKLKRSSRELAAQQSRRPAALGRAARSAGRAKIGRRCSRRRKRMLAIAPQHEAARQARRRAWKAVGMDVTQAMHRGQPAGPVSLDWNRAAAPGGRRSTRAGARFG